MALAYLVLTLGGRTMTRTGTKGWLFACAMIVIVLPQLKCDSHCLHTMEVPGGVHESTERQEANTAPVHP
jgi:hypothetical protein